MSTNRVFARIESSVRRFHFGVALVALTIGGFVAGFWTNGGFLHANERLGLDAPLPSSMAELVETSDVIVLARVGETVQQKRFFGYGADERSWAKLEAQSGRQLSLPLVDLRLEVLERIQDDDLSRAQEEMVLRLVAHHDENLRDPSAPKSGDTLLLFLSRNPDAQTYGLRSFAHAIRLDGRTARFTMGSEVRLPFDTAMSPEAFVDTLIDEVARR